ncbi:rab-protein geranylgeranyltransferase [Rickenella mellea]|uniref:Geranylgeranyl transferase type-2 subunit alpha n=1 Tax=Rickenella mellea TaxID=50990 RepID=A0A4Y7QKA5_9AGAM|nr:rab-protein geranylgeranyltransferase [Rickenella mellea]
MASMLAQHGVKRARQSPEALKAQKDKETAKLQEYLVLTDDIFTKKKSSDWSRPAFDLTTRLLNMNAELYTVWNYRRNILTNGIFPASTPEEINGMLSEDLDMTMVFLRKRPKVYWIWNHRRWCLEHVPDGPVDDTNGWRQAYWLKELSVIGKMLDADSRNFLAWDYRRYVLASMPNPPPEANELAYTTQKIESNFSNFSAWHQRSKIYTRLWADQLDHQTTKDEEFELVKQAMYVDPNDQSAWIYHRWLIGPGDEKVVLDREISVIQELLTVEPDSKWCLESLVHYKLLLVNKHGEKLTSDRQQLLDDCRRMLRKLKGIDPQRARRYDELESKCTASS